MAYELPPRLAIALTFGGEYLPPYPIALDFGGVSERTLAPVGSETLECGSASLVAYAVRGVGAYGAHTLQVGESPRLAPPEQALYPYGQRCTEYGQANLEQLPGALIYAPGVETLRCGLSSSVRNLDDFVRQFWRAEDAANGTARFGAATVGHLQILTVAPAGQETLAVGAGAGVTHWVQRVAQAGVETFAAGNARVYLGQQWVAPDWAVCTLYGYPRLVRHLEIEHQGYLHTQYGAPSVARGNSIEPAGLDAFVAGTAGVRLAAQFVRQAPSAAQTAYGPATVANLVRTLVQIDDREGSPHTLSSARAQVLNIVQAIVGAGWETLEADPYAQVLRSPTLAPVGAETLEPGAGGLVAYAVRDVAPVGVGTLAVGRARAYLTARALVAVGAETLEPGAGLAYLDLQIVRQRGALPYSEAGSASRVGDAEQRLAQRATLAPLTGIGKTTVGLAEQFVEPPGEEQTGYGAPWVRGPFLDTLAVKPIVETAHGLPTVANVDRAVRARPLAALESGIATVWRSLQIVGALGAETLLADRATVADRTKRIQAAPLALLETGWARVRNESPDPPFEQWVRQAETAADASAGTPTVAGNVVFASGYAGFAPGAPTVAGDTIAVREYYPQTAYGLDASVGDPRARTVVQGGENDFLATGRATFSPWWVGLPSAAYPTGWGPWDPNPAQAPGFGQAEVALLHRTIRFAGSDTLTAGDGPAVYLGLQIVQAEGARHTRFGLPVILPHTQTVWAAALDGSAPGDDAAVRNADPGGPPPTQAVGAQGLDASLFGASRLSNWIQMVQPVGLDASLFGANDPMVHYPRTLTPVGTEQTVSGTARLSPDPQIVRAQGVEVGLSDWSVFSARMRVGQTGRVAPVGVETLEVGTGAAATLGAQFIVAYGKAARCQRTAASVAHG